MVLDRINCARPHQNSLCRRGHLSYTLESMKDRQLLPSLFIVASAVFSPLWSAYADGPLPPGPNTAQVERPTTRQYDKRLPPVMPGEEIVTETGQRMRVWSSAGPVPINPPPTPQTLNGNGTGNAPSVIIDGRVHGPFKDGPAEP